MSREETRQIPSQNLKGQCHEKRDQTDSSTGFKRDSVTRREARQIQAQNLKGQCHEKRDQTDSSTEFKWTVSREERQDRFKHRT